MKNIKYQFQPESEAQFSKVSARTVAAQSNALGVENAEPLIVIMDSLIRYAKAYEVRFGGRLSEDYVLGPLWVQTAKGVRGLLNGDGAVANEQGVTTDSKDNGCIEGMFWAAVKAAGFKEADLGL